MSPLSVALASQARGNDLPAGDEFSMTYADLCEAVVYPATFYEPPTYCDAEAVSDGFCERHNPEEPDPDRAWKERHEDRLTYA